MIDKLTVLSWTRENEYVDLKRQVCLLLHGYDDQAKDSDWYINNKIILKPQYFHSAMAIYTALITNTTDSFSNIIKSNLQEQCLIIAKHVLINDIDGYYFLDNLDMINNFNKMIIK